MALRFENGIFNLLHFARNLVQPWTPGIILKDIIYWKYPDVSNYWNSLDPVDRFGDDVFGWNKEQSAIYCYANPVSDNNIQSRWYFGGVFPHKLWPFLGRETILSLCQFLGRETINWRQIEANRSGTRGQQFNKFQSCVQLLDKNSQLLRNDWSACRGHTFSWACARAALENDWLKRKKCWCLGP